MTAIKPLYKIGDLTKKLNITPRTIRYYDQLGLLPNIKRSDGDTRIFDKFDIEIIEKTRALQKKQYLPLEEIKNKLFPPLLLDKNIHLITDFETNQKIILPNNIQVLKGSPSQNNFHAKDINTLPKTSQSKNNVYIYFYHSNFSEKINTLKRKIKSTLDIYLFPIEGIGFSSYMLLESINKKLSSFYSIEELKLYIDNILNLKFDICLTDTIDHFFYNHKVSKSNLDLALSNFSPIITSSIKTEIKSFLPNEASNTIEEILNLFETELLLRKRYANCVHIYDKNKKETSENLLKSFKKRFPKIDICISKATKWPIEGKKGIILSLI